MEKPTEDLAQIARRTRYPFKAFQFVNEGLNFTVNRIHGELAQTPDTEADYSQRHVSGRELCLGLRDYAIQQYGLLARAVLKRWKINNSRDFGEIVYAMINAHYLEKREQDSFEDFLGIYDFDTAFSTSLLSSENNDAGHGEG
jgi:uncharacterized repeat protein (TIGR04138 family)